MRETMQRTHRHRLRFRSIWWTRLTGLAVLVVFLSLLPVPWLVARTANPPGMAWRLDGRLQFGGVTIDPPGEWVGLTAGRPPLVAEVVWSWVNPAAAQPRDMRAGSRLRSPALSEPAAIAVGLAHAGRKLELSTIVEARDPVVSGLPRRVSVSMVNGRPIVSDEDWDASMAELADHNQFVAADGRVFDFSGPMFPYKVVEMLRTPADVEVTLAGWGRLIPAGWYRKLSLGNSNGLLLGLAAYSQASGVDLAQGRVIASTGVLKQDGTVGPVGGLAAKTRAADRAGVDLLVYPWGQHCLVEPALHPSSRMTTVPVTSLAEAIAVLLGEMAAPVGDPSVCAA